MTAVSLRRYQSTVMGSFQTVELIETFINYQESIKRCITIIYDPQRSALGGLAIKVCARSSLPLCFRTQSLVFCRPWPLREAAAKWHHVWWDIPELVCSGICSTRAECAHALVIGRHGRCWVISVTLRSDEHAAVRGRRRSSFGTSSSSCTGRRALTCRRKS